MEDMEKILQLSQLMGGNGDMDVVKMMEMAKKMNNIMGLFGNSKNDDENNKPEIIIAQEDYTEPLAIQNKQEKVINAAIPFLDQEYQKDLYILIRVLEMRRILNQPQLIIESRSRKIDTAVQRRRQLLKAVRPYLDNTECTRIDQMARFMEANQILQRREL